MNTVLILYPPLFACKTKFERKVSNIIKNMGELNLCYLDDHNGYIQGFVCDVPIIVDKRRIEALEKSVITHAIVFDDGEEFVEQRQYLEEQNIPFRWIKIPITRVVNIKTEKQYENIKSTDDYEYIGRGSYWGNPYSMYEEGESREEVIRKYQYDFEFDKFPNKDPKYMNYRESD